MGRNRFLRFNLTEWTKPIKGKAAWYISLEKYGSDKTLFIKDLEQIGLNFLEAKNKIEELTK